MTKQKTLSLVDHVETQLFVNKQGASKQYKTTNILNVVFTDEGVEIINLRKFLQSKIVLSKMPSDMSKDDSSMVTIN